MENVLRGMTLDFFGRGRHKTTFDKLVRTPGALLLDVRSREEASALGLPLAVFPGVDSINIPIAEVPDRLDEIPRDRPVAVFCPANVRASMVYAYLRSTGYEDVLVLDGGYAALAEAVKPGPVLKAVAASGKAGER